MNLRQFAYFVVACQQPSQARAAAELGITPSTLSVCLKALAKEIGLPLFEHVHRRLHPTAAGLWLFRTVLPLLHAERFIRCWLPRPAPPLPDYVLVEVRLSFALGRVTKAISAAIEHMQSDYPQTFIELHFVGAGLNGNETAPLGTPVLGATPRRIQIDAILPARERVLRREGYAVRRLLKDAWVVVRAGGGIGADGVNHVAGRLIAPALSEGLRLQLSALVEQGKLPTVRILDESPGELPRLLAEHPHARFLLPRSMVGERLAQSDVEVLPLERVTGAPELCSHVVAGYAADDPLAAELVRRMTEALDEGERTVIFTPMLTLRQLHCHQMLHRWRNMTAAARRLAVTQPSLTEQLRGIERLLGVVLFVRGRKGVQPTTHGERLNTLAAVVEEGVRRLLVRRASISGVREQQLRLGVLPTGDGGSVLLQCLADAITAWQVSHPGCCLKVMEAPSGQLRDLVVAGTLGLALVEHAVGDLARLNLGPGEPLAAVANPQFGLFQGDAIDLAALARLPLVLPMDVSGIRRLLNAAADKNGLRLNVALEVNSMALTLALLKRQALSTVLPVSAVRGYLDSGELTAAVIARPAILRRFYAMYCADRPLNETERDFVRELREQFASRQRRARRLTLIQGRAAASG